MNFTPHDSLHSLGVIVDLLIFYSLNPTLSFETLSHKPETASRSAHYPKLTGNPRQRCPSTPIIEKHPTLDSTDVETVEMVDGYDKMDLAFDLSLSILLGDNIYNFGELLAYPIFIMNEVVGKNQHSLPNGDYIQFYS
ncbi:hypothetical protein ACSQ67_001047 [Phaseolus vulgaris]